MGTNYIAITIESNDEGTLVSGEAPPENVYHDPGGFYYNKEEVHSHYGNSVDYPPDYPEINESLKILAGSYYNELRPWNQSGRLEVRGIYAYPFTFDNGLTILDKDKNGTVWMRYNNSSIGLKTGDMRMLPVVATRNETYNEPYAGRDFNGNYVIRNYTYTVKWVSTWTITNLGEYPK